jgi:transcriptional regulator with XRE-family HTH domain
VATLSSDSAPDATLLASPPTTFDDVARRRELGAFLRSRRQRITPDVVGIHSFGRRRTPGLRREEVATLAGVGVTWYTWLEQGRDIRASGAVLDAIGRALRLDIVERRHLFFLSGSTPPPGGPDCPIVTPAVRAVLDQLDPLPACVLNGRFDILAYNQSYGHMIDDLDAIPVEDRNKLLLSFIHPAWRRSLVEWEDSVNRCIGQLRGAFAEHANEPDWSAFVERLSASSQEFTAYWERHEVHPIDNLVRSILNDRVGLLRLTHTSFFLTPGTRTQLVTYTPVDEATATRLTELVPSLG